MKIFLFSMLSLLILVSCHDVKKQKQLKVIDELILNLSEISTELNEIDSSQMEVIFKEVIEVRSNIQENYQADTLSVELGQQLEDYKLIAKQSKWVLGNIPFAKEKITEAQLRINQLKADIVAGNGEREKYDSYIQNEKQHVDELKKLHQSIVKNSQEAVEKYETLHDKMLDYSNQLILIKKDI